MVALVAVRYSASVTVLFYICMPVLLGFFHGMLPVSSRGHNPPVLLLFYDNFSLSSVSPRPVSVSEGRTGIFKRFPDALERRITVSYVTSWRKRGCKIYRADFSRQSLWLHRLIQRLTSTGQQHAQTLWGAGAKKQKKWMKSDEYFMPRIYASLC